MKDSTVPLRKQARSALVVTCTVIITGQTLLPSAAAAPAPYFPTQLAHVGNAKQLVVVTSGSAASSYATFRTYQKGSDSIWRQQFAPGTGTTAGRDRWVFGDRESGAYLTKFAWTKIVRHQLVGGTSSPDDPALSDYWAARPRQGTPLPMDRTSLHLLLVQSGRCALCQGLLLRADRPPRSPREWEQWLAATRKALVKKYIVVREGGTPDETKHRLIPADCQRQLVGSSSGIALLPASEPSGLA